MSRKSNPRTINIKPTEQAIAEFITDAAKFNGKCNLSGDAVRQQLAAIYAILSDKKILTKVDFGAIYKLAGKAGLIKRPFGSVAPWDDGAFDNLIKKKGVPGKVERTTAKPGFINVDGKKVRTSTEYNLGSFLYNLLVRNCDNFEKILKMLQDYAVGAWNTTHNEPLSASVFNVLDRMYTPAEQTKINAKLAELAATQKACLGKEKDILHLLELIDSAKLSAADLQAAAKVLSRENPDFLYVTGKADRDGPLYARGKDGKSISANTGHLGFVNRNAEHQAALKAKYENKKDKSRAAAKTKNSILYNLIVGNCAYIDQYLDLLVNTFADKIRSKDKKERRAAVRGKEHKVRQSKANSKPVLRTQELYNLY